jgi:hypothetical protein
MPSFMTKRVWILLLLISGSAAAAPPHDAPAQVASPKFEVGPGPFDLDLDAGSGGYEERFLQVPAGAFTVKGFIQFMTVRADAKWAPMAGVELMGPKDSFYAGLIAFVLPNVPDKIQFAVRDERLHGLPDATFARVHLSDQSIPFELRLDKSGVLQVSVAGKPGRLVPVRPLEITRVRVLASTGHIRFSHIEITASDR